MEQKTVSVPVSVAMRETKRKIITVINQSGLPPCLGQAVVESILSQLREASEEEYRRDMKKVKEEQDVEAEEVVLDIIYQSFHMMIYYIQHIQKQV